MRLLFQIKVSEFPIGFIPMMTKGIVLKNGFHRIILNGFLPTDIPMKMRN